MISGSGSCPPVMETVPADEEESSDDEGGEEEKSEETEGADEEEEAEAEEEIRDPLAKLKAEVEKKERFARQLKVAQEELVVATRKLEEEPVAASEAPGCRPHSSEPSSKVASDTT